MEGDSEWYRLCFFSWMVCCKSVEEVIPAARFLGGTRDMNEPVVCGAMVRPEPDQGSELELGTACANAEASRTRRGCGSAAGDGGCA